MPTVMPEWQGNPQHLRATLASSAAQPGWWVLGAAGLETEISAVVSNRSRAMSDLHLIPAGSVQLGQYMNPTLIFDIEPSPISPGLRALHELDAQVSDTEVAEMAFRVAPPEDPAAIFCRIICKRVAAISCVLREGTTSRSGRWANRARTRPASSNVSSMGIDKYTPQLVSWNGGGFDLPVLHYRGLIHGVQCARYWDMGEDDREFKWNNYISRYHAATST